MLKNKCSKSCRIFILFCPVPRPFVCLVASQAFFIGVQIEVEDAEVLPFPTTRQTLQEMLLDEEEKDFWDEAELAPAQERAGSSAAIPQEEKHSDFEEKVGVLECSGENLYLIV